MWKLLGMFLSWKETDNTFTPVDTSIVFDGIVSLDSNGDVWRYAVPEGEKIGTWT